MVKCLVTDSNRKVMERSGKIDESKELEKSSLVTLTGQLYTQGNSHICK